MELNSTMGKIQKVIQTSTSGCKKKKTKKSKSKPKENIIIKCVPNNIYRSEYYTHKKQ